MKTICIIIPGKLPVPSICGGAVETLATLLLNQNELEEKVKFIVVTAWSQGIEEAASKYKNTEFRFFHVRKDPLKKIISGINYIIAVLSHSNIIDYLPTPMHYDIKKIMKSVTADAVIVEHGIYKHFSFLRKKYRSEQLYLHLHGTGPMPDKATKRTFGNIICTSRYIENYYKPVFKKYRTKFQVCLNGIDDTIFQRRISSEERNSLRKKYGVRNDDLLVVYCGRLVKEKGVKEVVRAVIDTKDHRIKLMVVGGSNFKDSKVTPYVKELQQLVDGHEDRIFFTGYVSNKELYKYYQAADLQVVCSLCEEAAGLVCIEGMLSGLPLLVTDSGGIPEYLPEKSCDILLKRNSLNNEEDSISLSGQIQNRLEYYANNRGELKVEPCGEMQEFSAEAYYNRVLKGLDIK